MRNMEIVTKLNLLVCIKENTMGLVKTRRLAAMRKQQRAIHLRQGYGGLKAGMKPPVGKNAARKGNGSFPLRNGSSSRDPK